MRNRALMITFAGLLMASTGAVACEYKKGETKFADYAKCRYGQDTIVVVDLPESNGWDQCVYHAEAFRPPKLLAITKDKDGVEEASINDRHQIGNPCYLSKQTCDAAFKAQQG